ncbi:hypothetical protein CMK18_08575 [Candidatus Poribacteria bacterium]|nr:hypothetical protein [Candidatus Poribacteria bacterium]
MQAIILCGGLSTRLGSITKEIPKILLSVGNQTIIDYQIDLLKTANVTEVILASGHLHEIIIGHVGYQHKGLKVLYAKENKKLGTGGAIKNAMAHIVSEPFFALNGDVLIQGINLGSMVAHYDHVQTNIKYKIDGILLSSYADDIRDFGEIISDQNGKIVSFREKQKQIKSGYINSGIYLFNQSICNYFPNQDTFSIEHDVFPKVNCLYTFQSKTELIDVGVPERLESARQKYSLS